MFTRETQEWTLQQLFKKLEVPYGITGHKKNSENLLTKGENKHHVLNEGEIRPKCGWDCQMCIEGKSLLHASETRSRKQYVRGHAN